MRRLILEEAVLMAVVWLSTVPGSQTQMMDECVAHNNSCDECIAFSPDCLWCTLLPSEVSDAALSQCRNRSNVNVLQCPGAIQDPQDSVDTVRADPAVPLIPQAVNMKLRRGKPQTFQLQVSTGRDQQLDVYFLMDFSASLEGDLETLRTLARELTSTFSSLSTDWHVGFGSFVDKPLLPWALPSYRVRSNGVYVCLNNAGNCENTYSFRQLVPLTNDVDRFFEELNNIAISASTDNPEGGLDALLQVAACPEIIGWRSNSVHLVVFITDANYHIAGDGKLGGIVRPNDGRCHMELVNGSYEYTTATVYDYPSIYQLSNALRQQDIITLFAVDQDRLATYERLSNTFPSLAVARDFTSTNLIQIIQQNVQVLVEPVPDAVPGLSFTVTPPADCSVEGFSSCLVRYNTTVIFDVTVTLEDCSILNTTTETNIVVSRVGMQTVLTVTPMCKCECSGEEQQEPNSMQCNVNGSLVCGVCMCNPGRSGPTCQCDDKPQQCPSQILEDNTQIVCSGRGRCDECNQCVCNLEPVVNRPYTGTACECSNACPENRNSESPFFGEICSGNTRGTCRCDGQACECRTAPLSGLRYFSETGRPCECDPDRCYNPDYNYTEGLCVNVGGGESGDCTCVGCMCPDGVFVRKNSCYPPTSICEEYRPCARCAKNFSSEAICMQMQCASMTELVMMDETIPSSYDVTCVFQDDRGCDHMFFAVGSDETEPILVEMEESCPQPANNLVWIVPLVLILLILLVGILGLIIAKIVLVILYRREYKTFEKEVEEVDWQRADNPIYVSPTQDYRNVTYRKQQTTVQPSATNMLFVPAPPLDTMDTY